jgi:hypothetical protein
MARALLITPEIREACTAAVARARAHPIAWETLKQYAIPRDRDRGHVTLADRAAPGFRPVSEGVKIPIGIRAAISFEVQPAGLCAHLSISVDRPGKLPHPAIVNELAGLFGFTLPVFEHSKIWVEEFEPGHEAVNVVELVEPRQPQGSVQ